MKHLAAILAPPPNLRHPHDYDWRAARYWKAEDFRTFVAGRTKRCDITFGNVIPAVDLGYGTTFCNEWDTDDYVCEGIEFTDGTCLVAWSVSEFCGTFVPHDVIVRYFLLMPRPTRWKPDGPRDTVECKWITQAEAALWNEGQRADQG